MSILDWGCNEDVIVYPEEVTTDMDGNIRTRASSVGIPAKARLQVQGQSGTSSRRQEQDNEGFQSEKVYSLRFPRGFQVLGAQSELEWRGQRWAIFGDVNRYVGSRRTAHDVYTIKRY